MSTGSKKCVAFFNIPKGSEWIARLMEEEQNPAMGSGGYMIERAADAPDGMIHLTFYRHDCRPTAMHHVFIKDSEIFATYMSGWVLNLLFTHGFNIIAKQIETPPFIQECVEKIPA
jgi:hypothetical protein